MTQSPSVRFVTEAAQALVSTADRARANHTGTQSADTIVDGTTNKAFLATERSKLTGIAAAATANRSDAATDSAISTAISNLIAGAPGALDTLKEIADQLALDESAAATLTTLIMQRTMSAAPVALSTAGTLTANVQNLLDATAGPFTATLPTPARIGQLLVVERVDTSTNLISIGGTVRGLTSGLPTLPGLGVSGESITFAAESLTSWRPIASHKPKGLLDRNYVSPLAKTSTRAAAPLSRVNIIDQGAVADTRTVSDAAITAASNTLTSATAAFAATDVGKTVIVGFAGLTGPSTTTTASLSSGSTIASITVAALPSTLLPGTVVLTSGGSIQAFETTGAASGATAIPVKSQLAAFLFASGSTVSTPIRPLKTTIAAVNSANSVTLAAPAGATVTAGEMVWGTDNRAAIQSAISAAQALRVPLYVPAAPVGVDGYLYDGVLTVSDHLAIEGDGSFGAHTAGGGLYSDNMPSETPYLSGSILIQAAQGADGIAFTRPFSVNPIRNIGLRFAGKFIATGHGFHWTPPVTSSTYLDNGLMDSVIEGVKVYGHDGNHYAYDVMNSLYTTWTNCHSFGGGGLLVEQNSNTCSCGNAVFNHFYSVLVVGGSAQGILLANYGNTGYLNYLTFIRPQSWIYSAPALVTAGYAAPTSSQKQLRAVTTGAGTTPSSAGTVSNITYIAPDMESNVSAQPDFTTPSGYGTVLRYPGVGNGLSTGSAPTTAALNTTGTSVQWAATFEMCPIPGTNAEVLLQTGGTNNPTFTQVHEIMPAALANVATTLSAALVTGAGITTLPVAALAAALPQFSAVTVVSGASVQTWTLSAAAVKGATSLTVYSQTPNFAYPSGSNLYGSIRRTVVVPWQAAQWLKATLTQSTFVLNAANSFAYTN